ncbi:dihydrofolate reductase [Cryobacterium fucosi]|uniref:Dihydrofolate reductase n=1 Tax=Cryobacterium fucosi TaxID=1259157 RepID=A0A4R9B7P6_9MICO|nr:dihydrofolate reductase [Cryobacterium fucosi]TFD77635.1 dihydrofolate reductase [Cryobacterium fucosi]
MTLGLIWAESSNRVIGFDGAMPWHLPEDLAHFKALTNGGAVLMGRRTWDSLPPRFRPLPGRTNIVITRQPDWRADGAVTAHSVDDALALAPGTDAWVIGGLEIFALTIAAADVLKVTEINADYPGDTAAPAIPAGWRRAAVDPEQGWHTSRTGLEYRFVRYLPR